MRTAGREMALHEVSMQVFNTEEADYTVLSTLTTITLTRYFENAPNSSGFRKKYFYIPSIFPSIFEPQISPGPRWRPGCWS